MMEITNVLQHLFQKPALEEVSLSSLQEMVEKYPYFAGARFLLSKKLKQENNDAFPDQLQKANLYFHNPIWLHFNIAEPAENTISAAAGTIDTTTITALPEITIPETDIKVVEENEDAEEPASEIPDIATGEAEVPVPEATQETSSGEPARAGISKEELAFDPYHTIDYFASLGIRLSQDPKPEDKLGQQLKSFTAWLKTMRRLPAETINETVEVNQADLNAHIEKIAAHSLVDKEVITQAMAEVLIMQGNRQKAAEIYHKLSLLNPDKSAYFAARIEELKQN